MSRRRGTSRFGARGAVVVTIVLLALAAFCIFQPHCDGADSAGVLRACLAMATSGLPHVLISVLVAAGTVLTLAVPRVATATLGAALPPPKQTVSL